MASELRVNSSTNRSGLGTITYTDSGPIISGVGTFTNGFTVDGTQTTVKSLKLTGDNYNANWFKTTNKLRFNDNAKATFGTADDLSIYHDGGNTRINNATGVLNIQSDDFQITDASNTTTRFRVDADGPTYLRYNGSNKFETSNTGVTITGTAVAGALDISGDIDVDGHTNLDNVSVAGVTTFTGNANFGSNGYISGSANFTLTSNKLRVTGSDTVGIECQRSSNATIQITETTNNTDLQLRADSNGGLVRTASNTSLNLGTNQKKRIQITSDGKVQIGLPGNVESLAGGVEVVNIRAMTDGNLIVRAIGSISGAPSGSGVGIDVLNDANNAVKDLALRGSTVIFKGASDETLRISSDGNVSIGGISPVATSTAYNGATLHIHQTTSGSNYGPQIRLTSAHTGSATGDGSHISVYSTSLYINNQENGDTHFYNNGSPTATIKANGSFGIGTQAPTDKLHVNGTALVSSNFYCNNNVYLAANKGIYFDGGTGSANLLDDYEEGSYVVSVTGSSSGSFALNPNSFRYTKIGRTVHVSGRFYVVSGSPTGAEVRVSLPFTASSHVQSQDGSAYSYVSTWNAYSPNNDYQMVNSVIANTAYSVLIWIVPNGQWISVSPSSHMNQRNAYYGFDFTYTTAT